MKKIESNISLDYIFNTEHKGAPYTLDGGCHWLNGGEFAEAITKHVFGYEPVKDASTPYDKGSDIEELNASVKSSRFTLTTVKLGDTFDEIIESYFATVHSTLWIYTVVIERKATLYLMNADEFKNFLYSFAGLNERKLIRGKATSTKMIRWFEERVEG